MNILDSIQVVKVKAGCGNCIHFQNDPAIIEEMYPGLRIMSSGYASVRDKDGLCNLYQLYLSARDNCPHFSSRRTGSKSPR